MCGHTHIHHTYPVLTRENELHASCVELRIHIAGSYFIFETEPALGWASKVGIEDVC